MSTLFEFASSIADFSDAAAVNVENCKAGLETNYCSLNNERFPAVKKTKIYTSINSNVNILRYVHKEKRNARQDH